MILLTEEDPIACGLTKQFLHIQDWKPNSVLHYCSASCSNGQWTSNPNVRCPIFVLRVFHLWETFPIFHVSGPVLQVCFLYRSIRMWWPYLGVSVYDSGRPLILAWSFSVQLPPIVSEQWIVLLYWTLCFSHRLSFLFCLDTISEDCVEIC